MLLQNSRNSNKP